MTAPWVPHSIPTKAGDPITFTDAAGIDHTVTVISIGMVWTVIAGKAAQVPGTAVVSYTDANGGARTAALGWL